MGNIRDILVDDSLDQMQIVWLMTFMQIHTRNTYSFYNFILNDWT